MARELGVELVDCNGELWAGQASFVSVPTTEGPIGIYPRHQPLLALLGSGVAKVELPGSGGVIEVQVSGGFLSVDSDLVTVVTDEGSLLNKVQG